MITRFKQPKIEQKTAQWYSTGYLPPRQFYPGVRAGRLWMESKALARQAYGIEEANSQSKKTKKDVFTKVLTNSKGA